MLIQFVKFGLVGVVNTAIHYVVFYVLYSFLGLHYLASSTIGYAAGLLNSYLLNRTWTFRSKGTNRTVEFTKFVVVNVISLGVNLAALRFFVVYGELPPELAQILAILFSLGANFTGNRFWTFNTSRGV